MSALWMKFISESVKDKENKIFKVKYSTPGLGFSVEKTVTEEEQRLLIIAVDVGREQMKAEIHSLLRVK